RTSKKIKWKDADGPLFLPARLLHGHTHCILRSRRRSALRGGRSQDQAYSRRSRLLRDQPARSRSGDSHRRRRGHDRECGDPAIRGGLLSGRGPRARLRHGSCPPATMALFHWNRVAQGLVHALARSKGPRSGQDLYAGQGRLSSRISRPLSCQRDYLLDRFSVADAYLFTVLNWSTATGVDLARWPAVKDYYTRMRQRPSIAKAFAE